jgi:hypothetical protein
VNSAASPEDLHKLFVQELNSGDLDALVALYAFDGFLIASSGPARGISAIRVCQAACPLETLDWLLAAHLNGDGRRDCLGFRGRYEMNAASTPQHIPAAISDEAKTNGLISAVSQLLVLYAIYVFISGWAFLDYYFRY